MTCLLCLSVNIDDYHKDGIRDYWQCQNCRLVFVKPEYYLSKADEKLVYDQHQNHANDLGYRSFLNKLLHPLRQKLAKGASGLDFGSGPGPTVSVMLGEQGFAVDNYDIYYANNPELLTKKYDFITCTEVIEHLYNPHDVLTQLTEMLKPNGFLGVMTKRVINKEKFKSWHYKNDPTHVCFYSNETFEYIAENWEYEPELINEDTVILKKNF